MNKCEGLINYWQDGTWTCLNFMEKNKKYPIFIYGKKVNIFLTETNHFVIEEIKK